MNTSISVLCHENVATAGRPLSPRNGVACSITALVLLSAVYVLRPSVMRPHTTDVQPVPEASPSRSIVLTSDGESAYVLFELGPSRTPHLSADDFRWLSTKSRIRRVWFDGVTIEPRGLRYLRNMPNLRDLGLGAYNLQDSDLKAISTMHQLESLSIGRSQVTDEGLVYIYGLSKLTWLGIARSQVTSSGIAELRRRLPQLRHVE